MAEQASQKDAIKNRMRKQTDDAGVAAEYIAGNKRIGNQTEGSPVKDKFDDFLDQVEEGFTSFTPEPSDLPFGKSRDRRPLIKRLTRGTNH